MFEDSEWIDWEDEDGRSIDGLTLEEAEALDSPVVAV